MHVAFNMRNNTTYMHVMLICSWLEVPVRIKLCCHPIFAVASNMHCNKSANELQCQHMSANERIAAGKPKFDALHARCLKPDAPIVGMRDELFATLLECGLGRKQRFHCTPVGVHPWNRYESGLDPSEVLRKISKTSRSGFSLAECARAAATERQPGKLGDDYERDNMKLADASDGQIPQVAPQSIKIFTLTVGHTSMAVRAAFEMYQAMIQR